MKHLKALLILADAAAAIHTGTNNCAAMCTGCHLVPGMAPTDLSQGLYPAPPAWGTSTTDRNI